jgi:hypothetical protein
MIEFKRDDNMSIHMSFDSKGLSMLVQVFQDALAGEQKSIQVIFDKSVTSMKRGANTASTTMTVERDDATSMTSDDNGIHWRIAPEDLDCLLHMLSKAQTRGALETPELVRVQVPKNKRLDYLYGSMVGKAL